MEAALTAICAPSRRALTSAERFRQQLELYWATTPSMVAFPLKRSQMNQRHQHEPEPVAHAQMLALPPPRIVVDLAAIVPSQHAVKEE